MSKKMTAADLTIHALEQLGITHTFGIPGVHNTELYDALSQSKKITPTLVSHEQGASFIAEGMSRVCTANPDFVANRRGNIGTLMVVPAAGLTHAASGIGEAYLDGVPMLVLTGGIRRDTPFKYKLHDIDQLEAAKGFTKAAFRIHHQSEVVETIYKAYDIAISGVPGPVLVEIPVDLQLFPIDVKSGELQTWEQWQQKYPESASAKALTEEAQTNIEKAVDLLMSADQVGLFVGYGARMVKDELIEISELLGAPVTTTLQGLSSFDHNHPLHAGFGFSPSAVPAAQKAIGSCDTLLTVGARFSEIPTGSFGVSIPQKHIHFDIDPEVIGSNYPTDLGVVADSNISIPALLTSLKNRLASGQSKEATLPSAKNSKQMKALIAKEKAAYRHAWYKHDTKGKVNPISFFDVLSKVMAEDSITVLDDGNHTFLAAELYPINKQGLLLTPTDFNAMGYAVPAAIGAKFANPNREVCAIVGDGCFTMTCMEILTAVKNKLGIIYCVFHDGELSQIAQAQQIPYQEKACTILPQLNLAGVAQATGAEYLSINRNKDITKVLKKAHGMSQSNKVVILDIAIDYSKKTAFTKGTSKTMFLSFENKDKARFVKRIIRRKLPF